MAALAYLLLPVSGAVAYLSSTSARTRWHGLQAIVVGACWPALLYAAAWLVPAATTVVALAGALVWIAFMLATAAGKDPTLPVVGSLLRDVAKDEL